MPLLAEGGEDAKPIAGGQSLVPLLNMRLVRPTLLVDLNRAGLDGIEATNGHLRVGRLVRQARSSGHRSYASARLREALPHVGHFVTRNRGTVGGSIAHADGGAELPLCLAALGGTIVVEGPSGRREIPPEEFFVTHFTTTLEPGELVVETDWPARRAARASRSRSSRCARETTASRIAAVLRSGGRVDDARVGRRRRSPTGRRSSRSARSPRRRPSTTERARGSRCGRGAPRVDPTVGTIHASPAYLRHLTGVLVERAVTRVGGGGMTEIALTVNGRRSSSRSSRGCC